MVRQLFRNGVASGVKLEKLKEAMELTTLDRDTLLCFISRVEVFEGKKVYVEFRGEEEFSILLTKARLGGGILRIKLVITNL